MSGFGSEFTPDKDESLLPAVAALTLVLAFPLSLTLLAGIENR